MKRKVIGLLTAFPEGIYAQRVMDGVFAQCARCGYDVAVFTPMVQVVHYFKEYLSGELNIYNLVNFDQLDGVIVDTITVTEDGVESVRDKLLEMLRTKCSCPVVSMDLPLGDYPVSHADDSASIAAVTSHVLEQHACEKIYFLTGYYDHPVANQRLKGFTDALEQHGKPVEQSHIFYGDFWYTGGEMLADRIISGEVDLPDAVICASDHMAIGLMERLAEHGIRCPRDIIITGYDATVEGALCSVSLTSCMPETARAAAEAVNQIRAQIEPDAAPLDADAVAAGGVICAESCGCGVRDALSRLDDSLFRMYPDQEAAEQQEHVDLGTLNRSFMTEAMITSKTVPQLLDSISYHTGLLRPYRHFWLCLRRDWLDTSQNYTCGYPEKMRAVVYSVPYTAKDAALQTYCGDSELYDFDTADLIPQHNDHDTPSVYYFTPVHFQENMLGYAVLERELVRQPKIGAVYHSWLRNINIALETLRRQNCMNALEAAQSENGGTKDV